MRRTFHTFFARVKRGERPGFPGYKSARRFNRITLSSYGAGIELSGAVLRMQGVGGVKVKLPRPAEGRSKTVAV